MKKYRAGIYMRLSKDDGFGESASISTQRSILKRYADENGIEVVEEYADDGYSGTGFERPQFKKLIEDIETGAVNMVIVKDLSRLGRNSARTSDYIDEYFPRKKVRFISVTDGYDSDKPTGGIAAAMPLMMAVHEMYARDTSNKIRSAFYEKMREGKYIGSFAPYGYLKSTDDKNRLIVNMETAWIVAEIFNMALELTPSAIAEKLNVRGISTPMEYRRTGETTSEKPCWTASSVNKILRNPVYTGDMAQGRTTKISFKSKAVRENPKEYWIVAENTHQYIVSREQFETVQEIRHMRKTKH
ncbi:MAG: recombinase family protein [Oscillospiraceae bacterium]|nr:recombinase family protein [Oscillospiraceae bacterium]